MLNSTFFDLIFGTQRRVLTSNWGWRTMNGVTKFHNGIDLAPYGVKCPLYSPGYGSIYKTGVDSSAGNYVYIKIGQHYLFYAHLDSIAVKVGQKVQPGTKIGICGTTGNSTGVHLHLGIRNSSWDWIEPWPWIANYQVQTFPKYKETKSNVRVRTLPSLAGVVVWYIPGKQQYLQPGNEVLVYEISGSWAKISYVSSRWTYLPYLTKVV